MELICQVVQREEFRNIPVIGKALVNVADSVLHAMHVGNLSAPTCLGVPGWAGLLWKPCAAFLGSYPLPCSVEVDVGLLIGSWI